MTKRILSGVQPTGSLHLGNYLGSIKNFIPMQDQGEALYCVVDQHAITVAQDPAQLRDATYSVAASFLASGVDEKKSSIFVQSMVPAHAQMAWILSCVARMGWLNRMTQFKEKAGKNKENASVGLFTYPVLMAADILCYQATHVPVGDDQKQHLELARDIAVRFNLEHAKADFFPLPEPVFMKTATRVMSLRDGTQKMSKSDVSDYSRINLTDDDDTIALKYRKAKTDAGDMPAVLDDLKDRPDVKNLFTLYSALQDISLQQAVDEFQGKNFSALKTAVADSTIAVIAPIRDKMNHLLQDKQYLNHILHQGAARANHISQSVLRDVYDIMGFV